MAIKVKQEHWWTLNVMEKGETLNPNWRPISFKNEFKRLLDADWSLVIAKENIKSINPDWSVTIKMAKKDAIVMKAISWAMWNKGAESTKMLVRIMEMFDWKAIQKIDSKTDTTLNVINWKDEELLKDVLSNNLWID